MAVHPSHPGSRSAPVVPHRPTRGQRTAARLVWVIASALASTLRWRFDETEIVYGPGAPRRAIFAIWHNRLALALILYRRYIIRRFPDRRLACLVSASRDGAFLARIIELFDGEPVRGSSSRRGAAALRELRAVAETGADIAITPDGPRGPRYEVQDGVVAAAQLSGLPILPVSYALSRKFTLRSWDQFQIPWPFSVVHVRVGPLLDVPKDADPGQRETLRRELEERLRAITRDA